MKKQFLRVKQYADQTFLKAEKSEALNNKELQIADQKVDFLRSSLNNIIKRLPLHQISEGNVEKRMKKYPEYLLGQSLYDQSQRSIDSECKLLQSILKECACVELELAKEQSEHESKVEQLVSAPIQTIIENDLPNIFKHKRNLNKYILDKDSASNRYYSSKNGNNKDNLKDNMEEADVKVEQNRDILATEMFTLLRKECELSQHMLQLLKLQRAYHESALKSLEKIIPSLEQKITDSPSKAVFGLDLAEHLRISNRRIAFPLELCIRALTELGLSEEGLFRVAGAASKVKRLKLAIDSGCFSFPLISEYTDVHVLASTLKSYLRDLPEPLLTYKLYDEWIDCMRYSHEERILVIQQILKKLPEANRDNLTYLIQFFAKLSKNIENKMNASNIAIVIAPNLLWKESKEVDMNMGNFAMLNMIVEMFVTNASTLFPDNVSCYLKIPASEIIIEESEFSRPVLSNVKLLHADTGDISSYSIENIHQDTSSPKPQIRRKAKLAPPVPHSSKTDMDFSNDRSNIVPSYPSGSTTLTRLHKPKSTSEVKTVVQNSQTIEDTPSSRRQSLIIDSSCVGTLQSEIINPSFNLVNLEETETADISYVSQSAIPVQISKAKPIQHVSAQTINIDKINITASNIQTISSTQQNVENKIINKPVAAPRPSLICDIKQPIEVNKSTTSTIVDSYEEMENDGEYVQLRKPINDNINEKPNKPAVPIRPASLKAIQRTNTDSGDAACQKTQCSMYSVANKQLASYVNIQNKNLSSEKFLAGHDMQMAEKEKFLGHHIDKPTLIPPSIENKHGDVNFNNSEIIRNRTSSVGSQNKPEIPPKSNILKSNEKLDLNLPMEKFNGNTKSSHTRTHSDGNFIETMNPISSVAHTPPSPRTLSKPTQPPPPPPSGASRPKSDSTDL